MTDNTTNNQAISRSTGIYLPSSFMTESLTEQQYGIKKQNQKDSLTKAGSKEKQGLTLDRPKLPTGKSKDPSFFAAFAAAYAEVESSSAAQLKGQIDSYSKLTKLNQTGLQGSLTLIKDDISKEQIQINQINAAEKAARKAKKKNWFQKGFSDVTGGIASGWSSISSTLHLGLFENSMKSVFDTAWKGFSKYGRKIAVTMGGPVGAFVWDTQMKRLKNFKSDFSYVTQMGILTAYYETQRVGNGFANGNPFQGQEDLFTAAKQLPLDYKPSTAKDLPKDYEMNKIPEPNGYENGAEIKDPNGEQSNNGTANNSTVSGTVANTKAGKKAEISAMITRNAVESGRIQQKSETEKMVEKKSDSTSGKDHISSGIDSPNKKGSKANLLSKILSAYSEGTNEYFQISQGLSHAV